MNNRVKEIAGAVGFMGLLSLVSISGVAALHLATAERVARNADLFLQRAVLEYNRQAELVKQKAVAVSEVEKWKAQRDAA